MTTSAYLNSIPYATHYVNDVLSHGWVAHHLKGIGEDALSLCPECLVGGFQHAHRCSIAAAMEPHRAGLHREGRYIAPAQEGPTAI